MSRITRRTFVAAPADLVWDLLQDFAQWHPRLSIYSGGPEADADIVVSVQSQDDETRTLSYTMPEPPFPITNDHATVQVLPDADTTCHVEWSADFDSDPGIIHLLEDQLGDDVFKLALDRLATAAHERQAAAVAAATA
jgi:carbon monoxide dehydrogenase subunit G